MDLGDAISVIAAFAAIGWLVKVILTGDDERSDEDEARRFFDEHGHWPDEDPSEAERRYTL